MSPPSQHIPRVEHITSLDLVPVPNTSDVRWAVDSSSRRWVRKHVEQCGYEAILAEALGWVLGRAIGVPLPDAAVHGAGDDISWLSSWVPDVSHWNPDRVHLITNPESFGRTLALDAIIFNEDRHARNILLQAADELHVVAWAIDCDHARVGWPSDFAMLGDAIPSVRNVAPGLPIDLLEAGALAGAHDAESLDRGMVEEWVTEACAITSERNPEILYPALLARMAKAERLAHNYIESLRTSLR